jgi:transcriptional regulator GlxA family with amidase domain
MSPKNTAILIFDDVEVLDFTGPYEVFNAANEVSGEKLFNVFTIANKTELITARNGLKIIPDFSLINSPPPDILIIPGGSGRRIEMNNELLLNWIKEKYNKLEFLLSVCTGVFIIANTGLLNGLKASTHHSSFEEFEKSFPEIELVKDKKYTDNGKIITAAGVSSGINMSLHVINKLHGEKIMQKTADYIEFGI